jgi:hypothetical protein
MPPTKKVWCKFNPGETSAVQAGFTTKSDLAATSRFRQLTQIASETGSVFPEIDVFQAVQGPKNLRLQQ